MLTHKKGNHFEALDLRSVTDNEMFWRMVAPFFSNKSKESNETELFEGNKLINTDLQWANIFNDFLNCIINELKIPIDPNLLEDVSMISDPSSQSCRGKKDI